jgi:peptidoglycan/LPS O-acetylase OafA/YrhL
MDRGLHLGILTQPRWLIAPGWHSLYLTNIVMFVRRAAVGTEGHLWSLCVEEHFYLLAPMVVVGLSRRSLSRILVLVAIAVASVRLWAVWFADPESELGFFSPMQFDSIAMGIAAAIVERDGSFLGIKREHLATLCKIAALFIVPLRMPSYFEHPKLIDGIIAVGLPFTRDLATAGFILLLWRGGAPRICAVFAWRPFAYLGKISYGLYLFHNYALSIAGHFALGGSHLHAIIGLALTLAMAMTSWHVFEKPINDLKRRLEYPPIRAIADSSSEHLLDRGFDLALGDPARRAERRAQPDEDASAAP